MNVTGTEVSTLTLMVNRFGTFTATTFLTNRNSGSAIGVTSSTIRRICSIWELTGLEAVI